MLKRGEIDTDKEAFARRLINAPEEKPPKELPKREYFYPAEIRASRFKNQTVIYTKCAGKESVESGNYREMWGVLLKNGRMRVHCLSVIRSSCIKDRSHCDITNGVRDIMIDKNARLTIIGMKRYPNP